MWLTVSGARAAETLWDVREETEQKERVQLDADISTEAEQQEREPEPEETDAERQERDAEQEEVEQLDADADGSLVDVVVSVEEAAGTLGLSVGGDLRSSYAYENRDRRDLSSADADVFGARWRVETAWVITDYMRAVGRLAGKCTTDNCEPDFILQRDIPTTIGISGGQITLDEFFLHWFRLDRFDLAIGRMQTKFVARGGVFAKSLDRNDSNNLRVTWTDGLHTTLKMKNAWASNLIVQLNSSDGASNVRQEPLDFSDSGSKLSYFLAFENKEPKAHVLQRGLDVSYLPKSLHKDGIAMGRTEDYWGLVARGAVRWPDRSDGPRLRVSGELGYAPTTQTRAAEGLTGSGDVDGWAWNFTASIMNFRPTHNIGINFGRTDAGWLLSPQYGKNEQLFEIRYMWLHSQQLTLDIRGRWREDLEQLLTADQKRRSFDLYVRLTWGFSKRSF